MALGGLLDAIKLGTSARHPVDGMVDVILPPAQCWGYPAEDGGGID